MEIVQLLLDMVNKIVKVVSTNKSPKFAPYIIIAKAHCIASGKFPNSKDTIKKYCAFILELRKQQKQNQFSNPVSVKDLERYQNYFFKLEAMNNQQNKIM